MTKNMEQGTLPTFVPKTIKTKNQMQIGSQKYLNTDTGEVEEFTVITKNVTADFNFHKVWLTDLLSVLDNFGNKKIKLLSYLLKNMRNDDNSVLVSYAKIQRDTDITKPTISATMKELIACDIIRKYDDMQSLYYFNPDLIVKGGTGKRQRLLIDYVDLGKKPKELMDTDDYYDKSILLNKNINNAIDVGIEDED